MAYNKVKISTSSNPKKKLMAVFSDSKNPYGRTKTTHFGATGMSDYPAHKDEERKQRYLTRHRKRENWNAPQSAGALSRWILWNKTSRKASIADYKKRFNF